MTKQELDNLPSGLNFVLSNIIYQCRENPPTNWPLLAYELIDRQDLAALGKNVWHNYHLDHVQNENVKCDSNFNYTERNDGMEFDYTVSNYK
jgi:hypothetical protein